jgi:Flp pilus assembly protein TadD
VRLQPDDPKVLTNLAYLLATDAQASPADRQDGVHWAERAAQLTERQNPLILDTLAIAYAAVGRFNEAITTAQAARALAAQAAQPGVADRIRKHLELFQQGRPVQQPAPASQP